MDTARTQPTSRPPHRRRGGAFLSGAAAALLAVLLLAGPGAARRAHAENWALLIGVADYENEGINDLKVTVQDVRAVADGLQKHAGFPADPRRVVVMGSDRPKGDPLYPTHINVLKQLRILTQQMKPGDTFVLYFSGHGFARQARSEGSDLRRHFLGTVNADPFDADTLQGSTVPLDVLRERLREIAATQVFLILDCCRNDPLSGKGDGDNRRTAALSGDMKRLVEATGSPAGAKPKKPVKGAAAAAEPRRSAILFACREGEQSYEDPQRGLSAFTVHLLDGLRGGAADPKGRITVTGLAEYVGKGMTAWTRDNPDKPQQPDLLLQGGTPLVLATVAGRGSTGAPWAANPGANGEPSAPVEIDTRARLSFAVTDEATGKPIPGARITVGGAPAAGGAFAENLLDSPEKEVEIKVTAPGYGGKLLRGRLARGRTVAVAVALAKSAAASSSGSSRSGVGSATADLVAAAHATLVKSFSANLAALLSGAEGATGSIVDPARQNLILAAVACAQGPSGDPDAARANARKAIEAAASVDNVPRRAAILSASARALALAGDAEGALAAADAAQEGADSVPADEGARANLLADVARARARAGDADGAREAVALAEKAADAIPLAKASFRGPAWTTIARALAAAGDADNARRLAQRAEQAAAADKDAAKKTVALAEVAVTLGRAGDSAGARRLAGRAELSADSIADPTMRGSAWASISVARALAGDKAGVARALTRAAGALDASTERDADRGTRSAYRALSLADMAAALALTGNDTEAKSVAELSGQAAAAIGDSTMRAATYAEVCLRLLAE